MEEVVVEVVGPVGVMLNDLGPCLAMIVIVTVIFAVVYLKTIKNERNRKD